MTEKTENSDTPAAHNAMLLELNQVKIDLAQAIITLNHHSRDRLIAERRAYDLQNQLDQAKADLEKAKELHDRRVTELIEANNREVERRRVYARDAERLWTMIRLGPKTYSGRLWTHVKRGTHYVEVGVASLQAATGPVTEGSQVVIYEDEEGRLWAREKSEFDDGRFVAFEL